MVGFIVILALFAYIIVETELKYLAYILWGVVNLYWGVIKLIDEEYWLSSMFFIYLVFCIYNIWKITKKGKNTIKENLDLN